MTPTQTNTNFLLGDLMLEAVADGSYAVFKAKGYPEKKQTAKIDGEPIVVAYRFPRHDFVLLRTDSSDHLRSPDNQPLGQDNRWQDFYLEPNTNSLFRQDERGTWFDLEGFALSAPIFLREDVLVSLPGKTSRRSLAFTGQEVVISPHAKLIQVGKLLYNQALEVVHFFGERVTGLGRKHISFGGTDQWQEVQLGLQRRAFLNEFTGAPLLINDEEVTNHLRSVTRGNHHFEVFRTAKRSYVVENHSAGVLRYEGSVLEVIPDTYLQLEDTEIIRVNTDEGPFYLDLQTRKPFAIKELGQELLVEADNQPVRVKGLNLYSMQTAHRSFVYDSVNRQAFSLADSDALPTAVRPLEGFNDHWFMAELDGRWRLCNSQTLGTIQLGDEQFEIREITGKPGDKLVNALTASGRHVTLDVRRGLTNVRLAKVNGEIVERIIGKPYRLGSMAIQQVEIASLGGAVNRYVDLEETELQTFGLPRDLTQYPDQPQLSAFAGNPFTKLNFEKKITIQGETFYVASFLTYAGEERQTFLQTINARPLHLDGAGHRNELVVAFNRETIEHGYRLGEHVMVSVSTLTEDLKAGELLYSLHTNKSWLPFYDDFLPVFRRAFPLKGEGLLPIMLFESLEHIGTGEYVAVEQNEPYRLLAERKKGKVIPKIVTTKSRALIDPAEVSGLVDLFVDRGMLVEVIR